MPSLTVILIFIAFLLAAAFITGLLMGFSSYGQMAQREIRERLAQEKYNGKKTSVFSESRREARARVDSYPLVSIKAPVLDSAGVPLVNEELVFPAKLVDISKNGCAIISGTFLTKGLDIQITCADPRIGFAYRGAEVRNTALTPHGIRMGLQFLKPLDLPSAMRF